METLPSNARKCRRLIIGYLIGTQRTLSEFCTGSVARQQKYARMPERVMCGHEPSARATRGDNTVEPSALAVIFLASRSATRPGPRLRGPRRRSSLPARTQFSVGHEPERDTIHAITEPGRFRAVVE